MFFFIENCVATFIELEGKIENKNMSSTINFKSKLFKANVEKIGRGKLSGEVPTHFLPKRISVLVLVETCEWSIKWRESLLRICEILSRKI